MISTVHGRPAHGERNASDGRPTARRRAGGRPAPHHRRTAPGDRRTAPGVLAGLAGLSLLVLTACGGGGRTGPDTTDPVPLPSPTATAQKMSEKNLGYTWPLTVDHGTAECREGDQAVFTVPDGTTYALNGRAEEAGYRDIGPVRATGDGGDKVSLGPLLSRTMGLCRVAG